jgi:preprotein translocase subunit SecF
VELFRGVNVDWLRLKWYFLAFSMIFSVAGIISMGMHWAHPSAARCRWAWTSRRHAGAGAVCQQTPDINKIRQAMAAAGIKDASIQTIKAVASQRQRGAHQPAGAAGRDFARRRPPADRGCASGALRQSFHRAQCAGGGSHGGQATGKQALLATLYSMLGMLVYLWFRFQLIYGVAAVVACFHDTLITVGAFALTNQEISLTVIAAILTLVGYSMNDTIVVFDRIRENLRLSRRESLPDVVNRSINQTLSRTVLTSGLTFLTVLSLYIFGGRCCAAFHLRWWWVFLSARTHRLPWPRRCWWPGRSGGQGRARPRPCRRQNAPGCRVWGSLPFVLQHVLQVWVRF